MGEYSAYPPLASKFVYKDSSMLPATCVIQYEVIILDRDVTAKRDRCSSETISDLLSSVPPPNGMKRVFLRACIRAEIPK